MGSFVAAATAFIAYPPFFVLSYPVLACRASLAGDSRLQRPRGGVYSQIVNNFQKIVDNFKFPSIIDHAESKMRCRAYRMNRFGALWS
jgi:hypothetical protein